MRAIFGDYYGTMLVAKIQFFLYLEPNIFLAEIFYSAFHYVCFLHWICVAPSRVGETHFVDRLRDE